MSIKYTLFSTPKADNQLMDAWMDALPGERKSLAEVSDKLDAELRVDAHLKGFVVYESGGRTLRVLQEFPLRAYFELRVEDRFVRVLKYVNLLSLQ